MIVDSSALLAILTRVQGTEALLDALETESAVLPAPARIEFLRIAASSSLQLSVQAEQLLVEWEGGGLTTIAFEARHAEIAAKANAHYGSAKGKDGVLNLLDLMVYAIAIERGEPLLCVGKGFTATDVELHPASRSA
ncbi:MAG: type II toxin-antitoxin system VapC family toxin [Planctomycetales bacterium]|nr:type II toxin-antitoxin system VapC family toxin [Planctomycetales bacterium]